MNHRRPQTPFSTTARAASLSLAVALARLAGSDSIVALAPSWVSAGAVAVKQGYDSNLYGTSASLAGAPNLANVSSNYTTVSIGATADLLKLEGAASDGFLRQATLSYAGDYTSYEAVAREDNLRNTVVLTLRGGRGPWTFAVDNPFLYVDGSKADPIYATYSVLGYGPTRERRNQLQERNASFLRYDAAQWFLRAAANATYYNLLIDEHNPVGAYKGYINWINRDDINTGLDFGYKLTSDFSFIAGWRIGQQTQARPYYSLVDNDNDYNRALFGIEGKPWRWLQLQFVAGPDWRRYTDVAAPGLTGARHTWIYLQGQSTATLSARDTVTVAAKMWHWVASPGLTSLQETLYSIAEKHVFSSWLAMTVGLTEAGARYDAPTLRNDWTMAYPVSLIYSPCKHLSVSADFNNVSGESQIPVTIAPGRNFSDRQLGLSLKAAL